MRGMIVQDQLSEELTWYPQAVLRLSRHLKAQGEALRQLSLGQPSF